MAKFHVRETFGIEDKKLFVMAGFILEGEITAGMLVSIPFNSTVMMTAEIDHLQTLERPDGNVTCLCICCPDPAEVTLWQALKIRNRMVDVVSAGK
jgi:hypothetical protein